MQKSDDVNIVQAPLKAQVLGFLRDRVQARRVFLKAMDLMQVIVGAIQSEPKCRDPSITMNVSACFGRRRDACPHRRAGVPVKILRRFVNATTGCPGLFSRRGSSSIRLGIPALGDPWWAPRHLAHDPFQLISLPLPVHGRGGDVSAERSHAADQVIARLHELSECGFRQGLALAGLMVRHATISGGTQ